MSKWCCILVYVYLFSSIVLCQQPNKITNGLVEVAVTNTSSGLVWSVSNFNFSAGPMNFPGVFIDGEKITWANGISMSTIKQNQFQILNVSQLTPKFRIDRLFQIYNNFPFVKTYGFVTSLSSITLSDIELLSLEFEAVDTQMDLFHVEQFSWGYGYNKYTQVEASITAGRIPYTISMGSHGSQWASPTSMGYFALTPFQNQNGFAVGIEFDGKSTVTAYNDAATQIGSVVCTIDDFVNHTMVPGDSFFWPGGFIGLYTGNWDEAGFATQQFADVHVFYPVPDNNYPYVQYDSWAYGLDINETNQMAALDVAIQLSLEVFVLDLGWAVMIGDWLQPDPVKFPNGLAPLVDKAHSAGLKFGLHMPYVQVNPNSTIVQEHPDWVAVEVIDYYEAYPLCLGNQPANEYIVQTMISMIDKFNIDYFVQDGEDMVKFCPHSDHTHSFGDSNYANSVTGFDQVIANVRAARPNVVIEGLADGGTFNTFQMTSLYSTANSVDNIDCYATRQGIYGATYVFSPRYTCRYMQDAISNYTLYSMLFGGPLIFMQTITEWNSSTISMVADAVTLFKKIRATIRNGRVIHIQAPESHFSEPPYGFGWDLIQSVSLNGNQIVLQSCRAYGGADTYTLQMQGINATATYHIEFYPSMKILKEIGANLQQEFVLTQDEISCEIIIFDLIF